MKLVWDEQHEVVVELPGEDTFADVISVERLNVATGESVKTEVVAPLTCFVSGLRRISGQHLLIGIRNSVICFDVEQMAEACRARQSNGGAPLEEDAIEEECLSPGAFDFEPARRHLYMLNGYYDEAALSCYELASDFKSFRRLYRREVCGYCPRGLGDLLAARGICVLPDSDRIAAVFTLENVWIPLAAGQYVQGPVRLCWVAEFSEQQDTWIEVLRPFDDDFLGDLEPMLIGPTQGVQFASAEEWYPKPVAIDKRRIAFATKTGKVLVTNLDTSYTDCVHDYRCDVNDLSFDVAKKQLRVETIQGTQYLSVKDSDPSVPDDRISVVRFARQPHKPKRHRPKALPEPETQLLSWFSSNPVAITADGNLAIAGRYVINLNEMQTICVIPRHAEQIREVAITHDATHVLTNDGIVRVFDGRTGTQICTLASARRFSLSPCERFVALLDFNQLTVWELSTGKQQYCLATGGSYISWSPDGKHIAFGGWQGETQRKSNGPGLMCVNDDSVSIIDAATGVTVARRNPGSLKNLCWTRHGVMIGIEDRVENWDEQLVTKNGEFFSDTGIDMGSCTWRLSPDHSYLAAAANHRSTKHSNHVVAAIYSVPEGKLVSEITQSLGGITDVSIDLTNDLLLISSDRLRLYHPGNGQWIADVGPEWGRNPVTHLSPKSSRLATRSWEYLEGCDPTESDASENVSIQEDIRVWDLSKAQACIFVTRFQSVLSASERSIVISGDGQRVAVPTQQAVLVWNVGNSEPVARIGLACDSGSLIALSHCGEFIAVCIGNELHLCDLHSPTQAICLGTHSQRIRSISFSQDSAWLVSGSADQSVKLWDMRQRDTAPKTFFGAEKQIVAVGYMPDLELVLASSEEKIVRVWNAASGQVLHLLDGPSGQVCLQLLPLDNRTVAAKYYDQIWIWDIVKAKPKFRLKIDCCRWIGSANNSQIITSWNCEYQRWSLPPLKQ